MTALAAMAQQPNAITSIIMPADTSAYVFGDTLSVEWTVDESSLERGMVVELSLDGGRVFYQISQGENLPVSTRAIDWVIDTIKAWDYINQQPISIVPISDSCIIHVYEYDRQGLKSPLFPIYADSSPVTWTKRRTIDADFRIENRTISIAAPQSFSLSVVDGRGRRLFFREGRGPASLGIPPGTAAGVYMFHLHTGNKRITAPLPVRQ
jgi:hypothetical protein